MSESYNIPAISRWVASRLPDGVATGQFIDGLFGGLEVGGEKSYERTAICESLLLDALAANGVWPVLRGFKKSWDLSYEWGKEVRELNRDSRISALLAAVQAIVSKETNV